MTTKKLGGGEDERTVRIPSADKPSATVRPASDYDEPTVKLGKTQMTKGGDSERTVLVRGKGAPESVQPGSSADPVVGWLVVIDGPGRGSAVSIGYGQNAIGRGTNQRVALNFGDEQISRENHATLTYDPRGRKFYIQHGGGKNLTYLGDNPVLAPQEISSGARLSIGQTSLRFVALCGSDFDWSDAPAGAKS